MNGNFRVFYTTTEKEFIIFNFQVKEAQLFKLPPLAVHDLAEKVNLLILSEYQRIFLFYE